MESWRCSLSCQDHCPHPSVNVFKVMGETKNLSVAHINDAKPNLGKYKNPTNRLIMLDYARWIFAFLVVVIHVPLVGKKFLTPLAFCAVPFFYMVTGYFLYDNTPNVVSKKIVKALKNYARIWIVAFSLLTSVVFCLKVIYSNPLNWTLQDFVDLFLIYGNCQAAELITINGISYGTSALWFLYGGIISLALLLCLHRLLFNKVLFATVLALYYISIVINYRNGYVVPRIISASFVFLYVGLVLHKIIAEHPFLYKREYLMLLAIFLIVALYAEQLLLRCESYNRILLLPASLAIFMLIISYKKQFGGGKLLSKIPIKTTLDIYLWHRLLYVFLVGVLNINFHKIDAIAVFLILAVVSIILRKLDSGRGNNIKAGEMLRAF